MTDQNNNDITRELLEAERLETGLSGFFASLAPPAGAAERLLARLGGGFHESQLTLNDGPYSFELAARAQEQETASSALLAAGLEEQPIDEDELDSDAD